MAVAISQTLSCPGSRGDMVVFPRRAYKHYGVNVGNGEIVHLTARDGLNSLDFVDGVARHICSTNANVAIIRKDKFSDFFEKEDRVDVIKDKKKQPLPRAEIVKRALSKVGMKGYNLFKNNCEHFARWCCYGEEESTQVDKLKVVGGVALGTLAVIGAGMWLASVLKDDSEEDERKVKEYRRT